MKPLLTPRSARTQTLAYLQSPGWPFRRLHVYLALALPQAPPLPNRKSLDKQKPSS